MKNKRGLSDVVTNVLLILLVVVGVVMIAGFLVPFVRNSLQKSSECLPYNDYFTFDESTGFTCFDDTNKKIGFSIKAGSQGVKREEIKGFKIVFYADDGTTKFSDILNGADAGDVWVAGGTGKLEVPFESEVITYGYNTGTQTFKSARVYLVLNSGRVCGEGDKIDLLKCSGKLAAL